MIGRNGRQRGLLLSYRARMKLEDALDEASYILQCIYVIPASIAEIACGSIAESACGCKMLAESACPEAFRSSVLSEYSHSSERLDPQPTRARPSARANAKLVGK